MRATAVFTGARAAEGMYESFYLRAVSPRDPVGLWIRYTVHKRPARPPTGSVWCTVFDTRAGGPFMHKVTAPAPAVPSGSWIEIAGSSRIGPEGAEGECGPARWSLSFSGAVPELRHLRPEFLYRAPLPRTKLTSPAPLLRLDGELEIAGHPPLQLDAWPGMIGHNWGREHAARWIWLHGCAFESRPDAWLDLAAGRLEVGGRMTPFLANGMLCADGRRLRLGGLGARPAVVETPHGCELSIRAAGGAQVRVRAAVPDGAAAGWRYADPGGGEHDVVNCSVSSIGVELTGGDGPSLSLHSAHGGAYELGMREHDHGVPLAPFADG